MEVRVSISKEIIDQAQGEDEFCQQIVHSLNRGEKVPYFLDQKFILYQRENCRGN
jgi:hypothetical protein